MGDMNKKTLPIFGDDIKSKIGGGVPVGTMAYWPGTAATLAAIEDDWIIANGATLNKSLYPELFKSIGYTYGGSGDNFSLPYMVDKKYVRCGGVSGVVVEAGLPNISGTFGGNRYYGASGAFAYLGSTHVRGSSRSGGAMEGVHFNAARSNAIYGKSTTVTPYSMDMIPIIKVK